MGYLKSFVILVSILFLGGQAQAQNPWDDWPQSPKFIDNATSPINLSGSGDNFTVIRNCDIRNVNKPAIKIYNVDYVVVTGCYIKGVSGSDGKAIKLSSSSGASSNHITIINNEIRDVQKDGISCPQRHKNGVNHKNVKILNNRLYDTGQDQNGSGVHAIYSQCQDVLIEGNYVDGVTNGNGISHRSSGIIRHNIVRNVSEPGSGSKGAGIKYFSDHVTGPSRTLLIENNIIIADNIEQNMSLANPQMNSAFNNLGTDAFVDTFIIRNNAFVSSKNDLDIYVSDYWKDVSIYGNEIYARESDVPSHMGPGGVGSTPPPSNPPPSDPPPSNPPPATPPSDLTFEASATQNNDQAYNSLDGDYESKWWGGLNQSIEYDFQREVDLSGVQIAFDKGDRRVYTFSVDVIQADGSVVSVLSNENSAGQSEQLESFSFQAIVGEKLRITGHGNNSNQNTSINEVSLSFTELAPDAPLALAPVGVSATQNNSSANNTLDGNHESKWFGGTGQSIEYDFGSDKLFSNVQIAFDKGDRRVYTFSVDVIQADGSTVSVLSNANSAGQTENFETFEFSPVIGQKIRITGAGNNSNQNMVLNEFAVSGGDGMRAPAAVNATGVSATQNNSSSGRTLDGDQNSKWWGATGQSIEYDFGSDVTFNNIQIAFDKGDRRVYTFSVDVIQADGSVVSVLSGETSGGQSEQYQRFDFSSVVGQKIRITGAGNTSNQYMNINEVAF